MSRRLENIGFYTLSDQRAFTASEATRLQRCELILSDACNFSCPYCRGLRSDLRGTMPLAEAKRIVQIWIDQELKNVRFSGGEPTLYKGLTELVTMCKNGGVERIAISTNGSASMTLYKELIEAGVNDVSVSLDSACCAIGDIMSGTKNMWPVVVENIRELSKLTYVTVGMVFTESNVETCYDSVMFAHSLGVSDIRVIPSAQFNRALEKLVNLPTEILNKYPILNYRIQNVKNNRHVRGMSGESCKNCWLALDDMAVCGAQKAYHFPCIIYMREGGDPIGEINEHMRQDRLNWVINHDCTKDPICSKMCLDVCVDYCTKASVTHSIQNGKMILEV